MAVLWRIELLGGLRVIGPEQTAVRFRSQFIAGLLAYLAFYLDTSHPRDLLTELLWPECDRDTGRIRFRAALHSLRRQLEPSGVLAGSVLLASRSSVQLNPERISTDMGDFRTALRQAAAGTEPEARLRGLREAVEAYHAELLPHSYEAWVLAEQHALERQFTQAVESLVLILENRGSLAEGLRYAGKAAAMYPLQEEARQTLMRLQAAAGHPGAAQREFRDLEGLLRRELDASPSPATLALMRQITDVAFRTPAARDESPEPYFPLPHAAVPLLPAGSAPERGTLTFLAAAGALEGRSVERLLLAASEHSGWEVRQGTGGLFMAAFRRATDAVACAVAILGACTGGGESPKRGIRLSSKDEESPGLSWGTASASPWRLVLDTGDAQLEGGEYRGPAIDRLLQILPAAHPGQCLCTDRTALLAREALPPETRLADVGRYRFRGVPDLQHLFQLYLVGTRHEFPLPPAERAERGRLPEPLTRFFGRSAELSSLTALLAADSPRLVTLTGPGGTGKTRLAMEAALRLEQEFEGALWFVPLADLRDPRLLMEVIRDALGVPRLPALTAFQQVAETLASRRALLVLDNFEQLLAAEEALEAGGVPGEDLARQALKALLERLPALTCLVTSRQWLEIGGEQVAPVPPLEVPAESLFAPGSAPPGSPPPGAPASPAADLPGLLLQVPSVQLFAERARGVRPDFRVNAHNAGAVGELCRRLEGLPLALELAASRVAIASPARMLERLAERLDFLAARRPEAGGRHRTLRVVCDWSYQLLAPDLKQLFARLSVFRGGWTLSGAEAVCEGSSLREASEALHALLGCSLILSNEDGEGEIRFRMLETLREYAQEQLALEELAALKRQHALYYLELAVRAISAHGTPEAERWLHCLDAERDNLRAALDWSCSTAVDAGKIEEEGGGPRSLLAEGPGSGASPVVVGENATDPLSPLELGLRLAGTLAWYWEHRSYGREGHRWLTALLEMPGGSRPVRANALRGLGLLSWQLGHNGACADAYRESLALYRELQDTTGIASALSGLGTAALIQRDCAAARQCFQEALLLRQTTGDRTGEASSLMQLGSVAYRLGDLEEAVTLYTGSLQLERELGNRSGEAACLHGLGAIADTRCNFPEAASLFRSSLAIYRALEYRAPTASVLMNLAGVVRREDPVTAQSLAEEGILILREQGNQRMLCAALTQAGELAGATGDPPRAIALLEEASALSQQLGLPEFTATAATFLARICSEKR